MPLSTQLELFLRGLKSMTVNFNIFRARQNHRLNITEPLWSVLETRAGNRFPPPASLKQHEDILQEEWYKIPIETVQNLYESIPRRTAAVLKAKDDPMPY
jgi:hypothetical protein